MRLHIFQNDCQQKSDIFVFHINMILARLWAAGAYCITFLTTFFCKGGGGVEKQKFPLSFFKDNERKYKYSYQPHVHCAGARTAHCTQICFWRSRCSEGTSVGPHTSKIQCGCKCRPYAKMRCAVDH